MKNNICPKCKSKNIVPNCKLSIRSDAMGQMNLTNYSIWLETEKRHQGIVEDQIRGNVCGKCGYIEMYISKPEIFVDANKSWE